MTLEPFKQDPFGYVAWHYNRRKDARYDDAKAFDELLRFELLLPRAMIDRYEQGELITYVRANDRDLLRGIENGDENRAREVLNGEWWLRWMGIDPEPLYSRELVK